MTTDHTGRPTLDLDAIRARYDAATEIGRTDADLAEVADYVPALLAEVERLRATSPATVDGADLRATIIAAIHADSVSLRPGHPSRIVHWPGLIADRILAAITAAGWTPAHPGDTCERCDHLAGSLCPECPDRQCEPVDLAADRQETADGIADLLADWQEQEAKTGAQDPPSTVARQILDSLGWPDSYQPDSPHVYREQQAATICRQGDTIRDLTRERDEAQHHLRLLWDANRAIGRARHRLRDLRALLDDPKEATDGQ